MDSFRVEEPERKDAVFPFPLYKEAELMAICLREKSWRYALTYKGQPDTGSFSQVASPVANEKLARKKERLESR